MREFLSRVVLFAPIILAVWAIYCGYHAIDQGVAWWVGFACIAIATLSIAALFMAKNWRLIVAVNMALLQVFVLSAEFYFDLTADTRLNRLVTLRASRPDIQPVVLPGPILEDSEILKTFQVALGSKAVPISGIPNTPTLLCKEGDGWVHYMSDEYGLNNPKGLLSGNIVTLAVVGDSFVHGYCVQPEFDLANRLRAAGHSTVNLGFGGSGPLMELARLVEFGQTVGKDTKVLWFFFAGNDINDLANETKNSTLINYLNGNFSQNLTRKMDAYDAALRQVVTVQKSEVDKRFLEDHLLLRALRYHFGKTRQKKPPSANLPIESLSLFLSQTLTTARDLIKSRGACITFIYVPHRREVFNLPDKDLDRYRAMAFAAAKSASLPLIDLTEVFQNHSDPTTLFPNGFGHYSREGYKLLNDTILNEIRLGSSGMICH